MTETRSISRAPSGHEDDDADSVFGNSQDISDCEDDENEDTTYLGAPPQKPSTLERHPGPGTNISICPLSEKDRQSPAVYPVAGSLHR